MNPKSIALAIVGILLIGTNLAVISPFVMGVVEETLDDAVVWDNEKWEDEEWLNSVGTRSYYAWDLTNSEALLDGTATEMEFEKVGPIEYEITTKREVLSHDENTGILQYSEVNVYEWSGGMSPDTPLTNINILWDAQRIGALPTAFSYGGEFMKGYFTRNMVENDLANRAPSIWVSEDLAIVDRENFSALPSFDNVTLDHVFDDAADPGDGSVCIALTCDIGPLALVNGGEPDNGGQSIARATMFGYLGVDDNETFARDNEIYDEISARFLAHGGGADLSSITHDNMNLRLQEVAGIEIDDEETLDYLMFGQEDGSPAGLLVCDSLDIVCGVTTFLLGASTSPFDTMNQYTQNTSDRFGLSALVAIGQTWAGGWMLGETEFEHVLTGGEGRFNSEEWLLMAFGGLDPVMGNYIPLGLNLGGIWGIMYGDPIQLDSSTSNDILYGEHGLATPSAIDFLFGEMAGVSVPLDENMTPATGGTQHVWDNAFVSEMYGLDDNEANSLRWLVATEVFDRLVPILLEDFLGATPYLTQSVNAWLLGWRDPVIAGLADDPSDPSVGWVSLEKNQTYYGSDGVSTESETFFAVYTGAVKGLPGEVIAEKGQPFLPWRNVARSEATWGLLTTQSQAGAVAGTFPVNEPALFNLGGYAIQESTVMGADSYMGLETVNHTLEIDPRENLIQAKLIADESLLDVFPGALPIYFGGSVHLQVEPHLDTVIAGEMNSYFYLDTRGVGATEPTLEDLQPVFQIQAGSGADQEAVDYIADKVVHNSDPVWYWTNFDGADAKFIDEITAVLYLAGFLCLVAAAVNPLRQRDAGIESEDEEE